MDTNLQSILLCPSNEGRYDNFSSNVRRYNFNYAQSVFFGDNQQNDVSINLYFVFRHKSINKGDYYYGQENS